MSFDPSHPTNKIPAVDQQIREKPDMEHYKGVSDKSLATEFAVENHLKYRFVGQWSKWFVWTGHVWEQDHTFRPFNAVMKFLEQRANVIGDMAFEEKIVQGHEAQSPAMMELAKHSANRARRNVHTSMLSARTIENVHRIAGKHERIATSVDVWDQDAWLLNTPDGTVDLRTGVLHKHNPKQFITKTTKVGPQPGEPVLWLRFLNQIMHGDSSMVRYLQKIFGYCLVGTTKEHQMYFGYGTGANGKGVTLNTIRNLLGDYGVEANIETFVASANDRHPTELADLRGARLVTCGETDEGQRWAEARIKMLTGGDPVKARFMRQDFFTYIPQFKLFLAGNHKPRLQNIDEAIERRFRLIPFTHTVPKPERDTDLAEKLESEWPMILQWCIDGCIAWQQEGLDAPTIVADATKSYLAQEDAITAWWNECCIPIDSGKYTLERDLFESWRKWAFENGESPGTKRLLSKHLEDREPVFKIKRARKSEGMAFVGVVLRDGGDV